MIESFAAGELFVGDVRVGLRAFAAAGMRARTCVTSPPYWGLRDYGVTGQIGLEPTIAGYLKTMVAVFRLVRDVLTDDGTLWLNIGDSYAGNRSYQVPDSKNPKATRSAKGMTASRRRDDTEIPRNDLRCDGLKPKDMVMMPARLALALQADGWWLRQDIIWRKPNPMPESTKDRCTKAHEYLFLLSKRERYYFNAEAIAEPRVSTGGPWASGWATGETEHSAVAHAREKGDAKTFRGGGKYTHGQERTAAAVDRESTGNAPPDREDRNRRSVWDIPTEPFPEAHFATFPRALVEPCIAAGSEPGDTVLDPFMGSGTTALVAQDLGRRWVGTELNKSYAELIRRRTRQQGLVLEEAS